jgi:hypothetical protein
VASNQVGIDDEWCEQMMMIDGMGILRNVEKIF